MCVLCRGLHAVGHWGGVHAMQWFVRRAVECVLCDGVRFGGVHVARECLPHFVCAHACR